MSRRGHGLPLADREVVQVLGPVADTVFLNVQFHVTERSQCGCVEPPARVKVFDDEQHVVDDDPPLGHIPNLVVAVLLRLRSLHCQPDVARLPWPGGDRLTASANMP